MQKLLTFFSAKIFSVYVIFNDQIFNDTLTNDIVSFEQMGPEPQQDWLQSLVCLFVLRFYAQSTQWGHVERGQYT